jgi:hypothetical protein
MRRALTFLVVAAAGLVACNSSSEVFMGTGNHPPVCDKKSATELSCTDGVDDDCDGYPDCRDTECEGQPCGNGASCTAGACVAPGALPELPRIDNVRVTTRGDTAIVEFEPVDGALDYRIYKLPDPANVLVGADGELVVKDAIYRCGGDRPIRLRKDDAANNYDGTLTARADTLQNYERQASEEKLGYVFVTPGVGRQPVYRLADADGQGGYRNSDWVAAPYAEAYSADYVIGSAARDALLAKGFRDDGIAFYAPDDGNVPVYRRLYKPQYWGEHIERIYTPGPEFDARADDDPDTVDVGERFRIYDTQQPGTVALHRLNYGFDVLEAGESRFQRALEQGNQPIWSLTWPGLTGKETFVIEALDSGCPFPGGFVSPTHAPQSYGGSADAPSLTMDEARLPSGELYINGQHDPANRPKPVARAYVDLEPQAKPKMDFYESFDEGAPWDPFVVARDFNNGVWVMRNDKWAADFSGCTDNLVLGPMLGQLILGFDDGGSSCNVSLLPRQVGAKLGSDHFVHVRFSTEIPSTLRRYPQIMISNVPILPADADTFALDAVWHGQLGPLPFEMKPPGMYQTIVVEPFGLGDVQVQFCDQRGWGVGNQCPLFNIYGHHEGDSNEDWKQPWLPLPVMSELSGHDRPVQFDVYASTQRVYVFIDDKQAGCAVLPDGRMPAGDINVAFRAVGYHLGIDDAVDPQTGFQYLHRYSSSHEHRHWDDLGIDKSVGPPPWDETLMPCGTRLYGGG